MLFDIYSIKILLMKQISFCFSLKIKKTENKKQDLIKHLLLL